MEKRKLYRLNFCDFSPNELSIDKSTGVCNRKRVRDEKCSQYREQNRGRLYLLLLRELHQQEHHRVQVSLDRFASSSRFQLGSKCILKGKERGQKG